MENSVKPECVPVLPGSDNKERDEKGKGKEKPEHKTHSEQSVRPRSNPGAKQQPRPQSRKQQFILTGEKQQQCINPLNKSGGGKGAVSLTKLREQLGGRSETSKSEAKDSNPTPRHPSSSDTTLQIPSSNSLNPWWNGLSYCTSYMFPYEEDSKTKNVNFTFTINL